MVALAKTKNLLPDGFDTKKEDHLGVRAGTLVMRRGKQPLCMCPVCQIGRQLAGL